MVNTREVAAKYRLTHWAQVLRDRVESGLSIKAYCKQLGICGNTYYYWQRRVRAVAVKELGLSVCKEPPLPSVGFSEVRLSERTSHPAVREPSAPSQLHIAMGVVDMTVDSGYPVEKLVELLRTLQTTC